MENEPEVIRQQMEETRAALTEKLETLEQQVVETVQGATTAVTETVASVKEAVQETVETVKDSVQTTVESVKETFDLPLQVERHPWLMLGGAAALGYLAGSLLSQGKKKETATPTRSASFPTVSAWSPHGANGGPNGPPGPLSPAREIVPPSTVKTTEPGRLSELSQTFNDEISKLKGLAIGTLLGVVRDFVTQAVPDRIGPQLGEVVDSITTKLGGQPISGPVLETDLREMLFGKGADHARGDQSEMGRPLGPAQGQGQAALGQANGR